jgi:hypothetical protein
MLLVSLENVASLPVRGKGLLGLFSSFALLISFSYCQCNCTKHYCKYQADCSLPPLALFHFRPVSLALSVSAAGTHFVPLRPLL